MASPTTTSRKGFGKRGGSTAGASGQARRNSSAKAGAEGVEFRYGHRLTYAGLLTLVPIIDGTMGFSADWSNSGGMGGAPAAWEQTLFSLVPFMIGALGLFWLIQGLRGGIALKVTPQGISAPTLYGHVSHDWDVIGRISVVKKPKFIGTQILSAFGADSSTMSTTLTLYPARTLSTWFRTPIEVRVCNADASLEEMLSAIAVYRPALVEHLSA